MMELAATKSFEALRNLTVNQPLSMHFPLIGGCGRTNFSHCGNDVKQFTYRGRLLLYSACT
jgi:hypothetical protein